MRFVLIMFVSFLMSSSLLGQKTFASRAMDFHWMFKSIVWANVSGHYSGYFDTAVRTYNGKSYRTFIGDGLNFQIADSGSKVYGLKGSQEYILMDYSLKIGDTFSVVYGSRTHRIVVMNKQKEYLNGDSLWMFSLKQLSFPNGFSNIQWIESIGSINSYHPLNWVSTLGVYDFGYQLDCVMHSDTSILKQFGKNCAIESNLFNSNKKWYTWASNNNGDLKFSIPYYFTNHDTTLFGKKYRTMNQKNRYVRYDSIDGKYFVLSNYNNGQELLVYSDRVKVGDTMATPYNQADTVVKIEYKWIEDDYRKVVTTNRDNYISGIGSVNRVLWDYHLVTFPEYQAGNICFEEGNTIRYHYPFFYQNNEKCDVTSHIQNAINHPISVYPNPVQTILHFSTNDKREYKIRNSFGVLVLEGECEDKLDFAVLPQGIYFLELRNNNLSSYFKLVKD